MSLCLICEQPFHEQLTIEFLEKEGFEVTFFDGFESAVQAKLEPKAKDKYFSLCVWLRPYEEITPGECFALLQIAPNATSAYFARLNIMGLEKFLADVINDDNYGF